MLRRIFDDRVDELIISKNKTRELHEFFFEVGNGALKIFPIVSVLPVAANIFKRGALRVVARLLIKKVGSGERGIKFDNVRIVFLLVAANAEIDIGKQGVAEKIHIVEVVLAQRIIFQRGFGVGEKIFGFGKKFVVFFLGNKSEVWQEERAAD